MKERRHGLGEKGVTHWRRVMWIWEGGSWHLHMDMGGMAWKGEGAVGGLPGGMPIWMGPTHVLTYTPPLGSLVHGRRSMPSSSSSSGEAPAAGAAGVVLSANSRASSSFRPSELFRPELLRLATCLPGMLLLLLLAPTEARRLPGTGPLMDARGDSRPRPEGKGRDVLSAAASFDRNGESLADALLLAAGAMWPGLAGAGVCGPTSCVDMRPLPLPLPPLLPLIPPGLLERRSPGSLSLPSASYMETLAPRPQAPRARQGIGSAAPRRGAYTADDSGYISSSSRS